ncbi:unnamed protein product [Symbiodinium natans]|uniref:Uncharacterized protein n=1 Tax=Symbiodinium natans TaxID=878477 RepID=A0A812NWG3_9DINO|nr:unnamed protein product [Symbiodinium natans]
MAVSGSSEPAQLHILIPHGVPRPPGPHRAAASPICRGGGDGACGGSGRSCGLPHPAGASRWLLLQPQAPLQGAAAVSQRASQPTQALMSAAQSSSVELIFFDLKEEALATLFAGKREFCRPQPVHHATSPDGEALGEARKHNSALQLLDLQHNQIGDTGAQALREACDVQAKLAIPVS